MGGISIDHLECLLGRDEVESFRTCMRRYSFLRRLTTNYILNPGGNTSFQFSIPVSVADWPPGSLHNYVTQCYMGWRGGIRIRIIPRDRKLARSANGDYEAYLVPFTTCSAWRSNSESYQRVYLPGSGPINQMWSGQQISVPTQGEVIAVDIPYYSNTRFSTIGERGRSSIEFVLDIGVTTPGTALWSTDDVYFNTSDDFNMFFFLGVQPLWRV